jgi:NAD(P)-dependent dehydrogenase (short-subunit alcohol dehydrogenase family)
VASVSEATPASLFSLESKVAVVTGASSGLGSDFARHLAAAGASVVVAARRAERLAGLVEELEASGARALAVPCDVSSETDVDRLVDATIERFGRADVLVNNAGITHVVRAAEESLVDFRRIVDTNLIGVFLCAQRFGRVMLEQASGSIVNVGSILGIVGTGQVPQASYAASKAAVGNLTRELAAQWARKGIRVNCIAPGWFETEMTGDTWDDESTQNWMRSRAPMGRTGEPGELAGALLFFASDASSFVTGQTLAVDGGWTII